MFRVKQFSLEDEYSKPHGITPEDVSVLRQWLKTQPHLPEQYITDLDLILAYSCCDRSTEVTKQVLDLHYTLKTIFSTLFKDRIVDHRIENAFRLALYTPLPMRTKEGYAIMYFQLSSPETHNFSFSDTFKMILMTIDLAQYSEGSWPGLVIVCDMGGTTFGHLTKFDVSAFQQYAYFFQEALLLKLKGIHMLNASGIFDKLLALARPFLKRHLLDILHIHRAGAQGLDQYFPLDALPEDVGGKYLTVKECSDSMIERFRANQDFFQDENRKRVTESKRCGRPMTISDVFGGVEGSFKKLQID